MITKSTQIALSLLAASAIGSQALTFTDRATFEAAVGPVTVEDFTDTYHFPIPGGVLNSSSAFIPSSGTAVNAGDIKPGVTYSTPVEGGNYFNIDAGGGFDGGMLDSIISGKILTITFDTPNGAFGFDTKPGFMGTYYVDIAFSSGPNLTLTGLNESDMFFGYQSGAADITSVRISGDGSFGFIIDNFTFDGAAGLPDAGSSLGLLSIGLLSLGAMRRKLS